ncbi:MAG TPA: hypothetical protein VKT78_08045 [Fimbriimonadaceae bacterium]|nr:hypothetical protein [Fimbriimonadaceae bacterium]
MKTAIILVGLVSVLLSGILLTGCVDKESTSPNPDAPRKVDPNAPVTKGDPTGKTAVKSQ